ncbi:unnamed protein product [Trichogramma brassicae]|uniref:Cytochrome b5 heme-binding domain-containing protein n=1 Tax=Trichogramma brassicae TaxID=86971 RepID=A0A6H5I498_9HYME|nr:unnamed protein product [Trichogramma brassicae]
MSKKLQSSIPGMRYPSGRDHFLKTAWGFLEGRRQDDGAEGLWRVHDGLYDLESFAASHPGGAEWIAMTKGTDITEAFEVFLFLLIYDKIYLSSTIICVLSVSPHYRSSRASAAQVLRASSGDRAIAALHLRAGRLLSPIQGSGARGAEERRLSSARDLVETHRRFLGRDGPRHGRSRGRLQVLERTGPQLHIPHVDGDNSAQLLPPARQLSHVLLRPEPHVVQGVRVSHSLSHHLYPNTLWDMEVYAFEPFLEFLPRPDKSWPRRALSLLISPTVMTLAYFGQAVKRYYSILWEWRSPEMRDLVPFLLPVAMSCFASSPSQGLQLWLVLIATSSFIFHFVGLTAAHHHPEIFHDGDVCRKDLDWGLMELDAVRGRRLVDESLFLILTNFGSHGLHHLLPTVDHAYLELCMPAFRETCREFGIKLNASMTSWQLIRGQYEQLARAEPRAENFLKTTAA